MKGSADAVLAHLDLFSGVGGLSLAAEAAGFPTVAFCERDTFCRRVLAHHWPGVPCYDDIHGITADRLRADGIGPVGIVSGGFPCQPFSVAGRRAGTGDDRHLWPEMLRVVAECRPRWVVGENVSGLRSIDAGRVFGAILADLAGIGYRAGWVSLRASDVGAPHRRERIFVVAYAGNGGHQGRDAWRGGGLGEWAATGDTGATAEQSGRGVPLADRQGPGRAACLADSQGVGEPARELRAAYGRQLADAIGDESQRDGIAGDLAGAAGRVPGAAREQRLRRAAGHSGATVADAASEGRGSAGRPEPGSAARAGTRHHAAGDDERRDPRCAQPGLGGAFDGLPSRLDGHPGWPARPGEAQHAWEPTRTVSGRVPDRVARLRSLGNAVVPQQAAPIFAAIAAYEQETA